MYTPKPGKNHEHQLPRDYYIKDAPIQSFWTIDWKKTSGLAE